MKLLLITLVFSFLCFEVKENNEISLILTKKILLGKYSPSKSDYYSRIPSLNVFGKRTLYLENSTLKAYLKLYSSAKKEGISLPVVSATRTFYSQKYIWECKYKRQRRVNGKFIPINYSDSAKCKFILDWSAFPGASRHHWGTEVDLCSVEPNWWNTEKGKKAYEWLEKNAYDFGFCQVYSSGRVYGHSEEKWHWSYLPSSLQFFEAYKKNITYSDLEKLNVLGASQVRKVKVIEHYVLEVNAKCTSMFWRNSVIDSLTYINLRERFLSQKLNP